MSFVQPATQPGVETSFDPDVLAARAGDRNAFARLVTRYRSLVSSISLSTVGNVAASEDVAQEVFLSAWHDLGSLRNPASFVPWLRQLTRHRALDASRGRRRKDAGRLSNDALVEAAIDPGPDARDTLLDDERARAVVLGLDALPDDARELVILYYREERSIEQVAQLLGLRVDAAKKRLSRARAALREEVLARFADAVESTAPAEGFTTQVVRSLPPMSPAASTALGKGALSFFGKSAAFALAWAWLAGIIAGAATIVWQLRRNLRRAIDRHERRELSVIAAVAIVNTVSFELAMLHLPPRGASTTPARLWLGTGYTLAFMALHACIYFVWLPRAKARRLRAETLAEPHASTRHAREARQGRIGAMLGGTIILAVLIAAWLRG